MFQASPQPVFLPCMHRRVKVITQGRMHFSAGEVWDDLRDDVLCLDCMHIFTEVEIRLRWAGNTGPISSHSAERLDDSGTYEFGAFAAYANADDSGTVRSGKETTPNAQSEDAPEGHPTL